jgi:sulfide:quinone oxidoreductase
LDFSGGRIVVGVCGAPFKCPPAPSECVLLLHDYLVDRGIRDACDLKIVIPFGTPVPPSPETSRALVDAFAERSIEFVSSRRVSSIDPSRKAAVLDDESELPFDLFLGVPVHRAPDVVIASGMAENGYISVEPRTLATQYPGVFAVGDVATVGVPKAGDFAEGAARVVAAQLISALQGDGQPEGYDGRGSCYIEFGDGRIRRVDVDFLSGPKPTGAFQEPSSALVAEKTYFGSSRRARWFGGWAIAYDQPLRGVGEKGRIALGYRSNGRHALRPLPREETRCRTSICPQACPVFAAQ